MGGRLRRDLNAFIFYLDAARVAPYNQIERVQIKGVFGSEADMMDFLSSQTYHRLGRKADADPRPPVAPDASGGAPGDAKAPVTSLTLIYDAACGVCTRGKDWISHQDALVRLEFLPLDSDEARARFPGLPTGELTAAANTGEMWRGTHAWVVCLWALLDYRSLAHKLANPLLVGLAREAYMAVAGNRYTLSRLLKFRSERELEQELKKVVVPACVTEPR